MFWPLGHRDEPQLRREKPRRVSGELVSGHNITTCSEFPPALGRVFFPPKTTRTPDGHPYAVLSYRYWEKRASRGDPNVIGQKLIVNGYPITVVGVSQAGFEGTEPGLHHPTSRVPIMMKKRRWTN